MKPNITYVLPAAPAGYEVDRDNSTFERIVYKPVALPASWESLGQIDGWWIMAGSAVHPATSCTTTDYDSRNVFPTKEDAEAAVALAQLCQLRNRYNGGDWKPKYDQLGVPKYYISLDLCGEPSIHVATQSHCLTFKTKKLAEEFLSHDAIKELIMIAAPLLG